MTRAVAALLGALLVVSCGASADAGERSDAAELSGTVTILAAASLTEAFEEIGARLEDAHPGLDVVFSFGPSSGLVEQALGGAPADVLATADTRTMDNAVGGGVIEREPVVFARNTLALIVPAGNPGEVSGFADLARDELRVAICQPEVPCGAASERLLQAADVTARPDTLATDVKQAASLVSLGEADAALVYVTDAEAEGDAVETIEVPEAAELVNEYPVALLRDAPNPQAGQAVVEAILGELGQRNLGEAGFLGP